MRDQLVAAVTARLERITAAQDPTLALEPGALADAQRLAAVLRDNDDDGDVEARFMLGWFHWYRYLALPEGQDHDALEAATRALTPCFIVGAEGLPERLLPVLAKNAGDLATALLQQATNTSDLALITTTVLLWQRVLTATPADHPNRAVCLSNLGVALRVRFGRVGTLADLDESIGVTRRAVQVTPADHPSRASYLSNLGLSLRSRFEWAGELTDLDEAIKVGQAAVQVTPADHPDWAGCLSNLGVALRMRFERAGALADLDEAVRVGQAAVQATTADHANRAMYLSNLGTALQVRYGWAGELADLDEAIRVGRAAVQATSADHPNRALCLSNLGAALQVRFGRTGAPAELDEAITVIRQAVQITPADHPNQAIYLSCLGAALWVRFERSGVPADLDEAITVSRAAAQATPADHANRALCLSNLGAALQVRFERSRAPADLDEAIRVGRAAMQATPADHVNRAMYLSNLGAALWVRFGWVGELADLNEAISVIRQAVDVTSANHPNLAAILCNLGAALEARFERLGALADLDESISVFHQAVRVTSVDHLNRPAYLSNLGAVLAARFERLGALADLDEAITTVRAAVQVTPADHPNLAAMLSSLGLALKARFERVGALADLDEAITTVRVALQASPADHVYRAISLSCLGVSLWCRFGRTGGLADRDEAITVIRQAVQVTPADHPNRATYLSNLGATLWTRFERSGELADLDEAVAVGRAAVQATPADHRDATRCLYNLGTALGLRFGRVGALADRDEAITTFVQASEVTSGTPSMRIGAARAAASLTAQADTRRAAGLLATAVRLLPETAPRRLDRSDQQYALGSFAGLASDAAALALADEADARGESAVQALRLLELGRGVMLSQVLDTRSDLTDLQARHPALAARFVELRDQFDQAGDTAVLIDDADAVPGRQQRRLADRHQLAIAFEATVTQIRSLDDFRTFLLPPEPDQLVRHAQQGPVVVVNVSGYRSDALVLRPEGITSVPLPDLTHDALIDRINSFHQALGTAHDPDASSDQRSGAQDTLNAVLEWLWDAAARPILDELGYRHTPLSGTAWPRLWWIPGGLLGFLPLHAAGYHREPLGADGRRTVMDRVISSYTPTVRALGYARERNTASTVSERALIVAMPTTPGIESPLRYVAEEAELVQTRLPGSTLLIEDSATTNAHRPTKASVLAQLGGCAIAHFACHGSSHPVDPSQSLLLLHDYDSDPFTVASLAPIQLEQARLAYLSACRTAFNPSTDLVDEAIHLTTAFQLAGYPHVVGTLWEIGDKLAVRVADAFYTALVTGDNMIDTRGAAQALHHAVRAIRDELPATPSLWAAYLHAGA